MIYRTFYMCATLCLFIPCVARADFVLEIKHTDFSVTNNFNTVNEFSFNVSVSGDLVAGGIYNNPVINSVVYQVGGTLSMATPSGFPGFLLNRSMTGTEFYGLSQESGLSFSVSTLADLGDGLQASELDGGVTFNLNAREFNQNPGRYHPPIFTLNSDGTGQIANANNKSTFPNPSSGMLVDVQIGQEYLNTLGFNPSSLTLVSVVPEPASTSLLLVGSSIVLMARRIRAKLQVPFR